MGAKPSHNEEIVNSSDTADDHVALEENDIKEQSKTPENNEFKHCDEEVTDPSDKKELGEKVQDMMSLSSASLVTKEGEEDDEEEELGDCCFILVLKSTHNGERKERNLTLSKYPKTGLVLKQHIESHYNIPVCVQSLYFHSQLIQNYTRLKSFCIQDGDTIQVKYTTEANIEYFSDLIDTLTRIHAMLQFVITELESGTRITPEMHEHLQTHCLSFTGDCVPLRYFSVFPTGNPNANQLYFLNRGGLTLLIQIYEMVHELPWHKLPGEIQDLEYSCLQIIWNFSATLGIRQLILQDGVMDQVFKSLMRTKIIPYEPIQILEPLSDKYLSFNRSVYMLAETIYASIVVVGNFAEIPQCRVPIASYTNVTDTLLSAMLSTTYTYTCTRSGMCAILCLSFSPETHKYICQEHTLTRILEVCERTHTVSDGTSEKEWSTNQTLIEFYALMFFANLLHHWNSESSLPEPLISSITKFMSRYIHNTTHIVIHQGMQEKRYYWSTFTPFLTLCYSPSVHDNSKRTVPRELLELCVKAGLLSMKCMCIAENAEEITEHEGLADFITCVSWCMPNEEIKSMSVELTHIAHQNLRLQPPSLTNIVKAQLASYSCGLEKALQYNAYSVVLEAVQNMSSDIL